MRPGLKLQSCALQGKVNDTKTVHGRARRREKKSMQFVKNSYICIQKRGAATHQLRTATHAREREEQPHIN
jgi:hypothetical protein